MATRPWLLLPPLGLGLLSYHGVRDDQAPRFLAFIAASFGRDLADLRLQASPTV